MTFLQTDWIGDLRPGRLHSLRSMKERGLRFPLHERSDCPCCSELAYKDCCIGPDGWPRERTFKLAPKGDVTGFSHPRCYMRETKNCSNDITAEHTMPQSVLNKIKDLKIRGRPGDPLDKDIQYPIKALASKVLCGRHNSTLSVLDAEMGRIFTTFQAAYQHAFLEPACRGDFIGVVSGDALELSMVKLLAGRYAAKQMTVNGELVNDNFAFNLPRAVQILSTGEVAQGGVRFHRHEVLPETGMQIWPWINNEYTEVTGASVTVWRVPFLLMISPPWKDDSAFAEWHPTQIDYLGPKRTSHIYITWSKPNARDYCALVYPPPSNHKPYSTQIPYEQFAGPVEVIKPHER